MNVFLHVNLLLLLRNIPTPFFSNKPGLAGYPFDNLTGDCGANFYRPESLEDQQKCSRLGFTFTASGVTPFSSAVRHLCLVLLRNK